MCLVSEAPPPVVCSSALLSGPAQLYESVLMRKFVTQFRRNNMNVGFTFWIHLSTSNKHKQPADMTPKRAQGLIIHPKQNPIQN